MQTVQAHTSALSNVCASVSQDVCISLSWCVISVCLLIVAFCKECVWDSASDEGTRRRETPPGTPYSHATHTLGEWEG